MASLPADLPSIRWRKPRLRDRRWKLETRQVACGCQLAPHDPERPNVCAYTLPAHPGCPTCHGTGFYTERVWTKLVAYGDRAERP